LTPGGEWQVQSRDWLFLLVSGGVAYWLHPKLNYELSPGSALLISGRTSGVIRASQLGEVIIHSFHLNPEQLTGLITWGERQALHRAAAQDNFAVNHFPSGSTVAEQFKAICERESTGALPNRLKLLDVFTRAFAEEVWENDLSCDPVTDAKTRLVKLLNASPESELLSLTFRELVRQVRCTPRHLSRIFYQVVGMSFREKQAQLRLIRAQQLLATTQFKVLDVALESGYQSLSLFNLMFKRRFGLTPGKWRDRTRHGKSPLSLARGLRG
jgi:AraC-like DNA-binding protein